MFGEYQTCRLALSGLRLVCDEDVRFRYVSAYVEADECNEQPE